MDCELDCIESVNNNRFQSVSDLGGLPENLVYVGRALWSHFMCFRGFFFSATTLKRLTGGVNNIDHLVTLQRSAGKHTPPTRTCCESTTPTRSDRTP